MSSSRALPVTALMLSAPSQPSPSHDNRYRFHPCFLRYVLISPTFQLAHIHCQSHHPHISCCHSIFILVVDHGKIIFLSTPLPTIPMLGKNCCYNVIMFYVGNKRCCIVLHGMVWYCIVLHCTVLYCIVLYCMYTDIGHVLQPKINVGRVSV